MQNTFVVIVDISRYSEISSGLEDFGTHLLGVYTEFGVAMKAISEDITKVCENLHAIYGHLNHGRDMCGNEYSRVSIEIGNTGDDNETPLEVRTYDIYEKLVW